MWQNGRLMIAYLHTMLRYLSISFFMKVIPPLSKCLMFDGKSTAFGASGIWRLLRTDNRSVFADYWWTFNTAYSANPPNWCNAVASACMKTCLFNGMHIIFLFIKIFFHWHHTCWQKVNTAHATDETIAVLVDRWNKRCLFNSGIPLSGSVHICRWLVQNFPNCKWNTWSW